MPITIKLKAHIAAILDRIKPNRCLQRKARQQMLEQTRVPKRIRRFQPQIPILRRADTSPKNQTENQQRSYEVSTFHIPTLSWQFEIRKSGDGGRMDTNDFNMSMRKFLKQVGVTSQQFIEEALRSAPEGTDSVNVRMELSVEGSDKPHVVTGTIKRGDSQ